MPKLINKQKNRRKIDWFFTGLVISLVIIGLIMLFSASYVCAYYQYGNSYHFISRQLIFALLGIAAMFFVANVDYKVLFNYAEFMYFIATFLLMIVLFMSPVNGAKRWIQLGTISFQPSEVAKISIIILIAKYVMFNERRMETFKYGVAKLIGFMCAIAILLIMEPHISGVVLIFSIGVIMMFVGGTHLMWFFLSGGFLLGIVVIVIAIPGLVKYAASRVNYWINPFDDPQGRGYQIIQSLYAIGSGGIFGMGIGGSKQKQLFLPESQNDFVFSIVCEELGFVGATAIILLFTLLFYRGVKIARSTKDKFGFMLVVGIMIQMALQTVFNIAVVTNTIPSTGIGMPFFSYGGTSLLMLLAEMGIVLSVNKYGENKRMYMG